MLTAELRVSRTCAYPPAELDVRAAVHSMLIAQLRRDLTALLELSDDDLATLLSWYEHELSLAA